MPEWFKRLNVKTKNRHFVSQLGGDSRTHLVLFAVPECISETTSSALIFGGFIATHRFSISWKSFTLSDVKESNLDNNKNAQFGSWRFI